MLFVSNVVLVSLLKHYKFMFPFGVLQVNLYILKLLPLDQENHVLAHQVRYLAMLFDYLMDEASPSAKCTSVVDVGLCKPVSGSLLARSFRGRDRRKMISWKDMECTSGYPY
jgi:THO complex subunit 5